MRSLSLSFFATTLLAAAADPEPPSGELQPPRFGPHSRSKIAGCYSRYAQKTGRMGRIVATVALDADGKVTAISLPPGIEPWQEQTARCVADVLSFMPATRDGINVASEVQLPLVFTIEGAEKVTYLKVAATAEELERALQACYPTGSLAMATPKYRVTVNSSGKAVKVELAESSGDADLDEAGTCVLKSIGYEPTMQGKRRVQSTAIIPISLRPPKRAPGNPPPP